MPLYSLLLAALLCLLGGAAWPQESKAPRPPLVAPGDATDLQVILETGGHTALIRAVDFTPDESQLVSVSEDKTIRIWDLNSGTVTRTLRGEIGAGFQGSLNALAVSPDGKFIATGGYLLHEDEGKCAFCGEIRIIDVEKGVIAAVLDARLKSIASLAFSSDGRLLVAGSTGGAFVWDVKQASLVRTLQLASVTVAVAQFTANDTQIVTGDSLGVIRLWSLPEGTQIREQRAHEYVNALAVSPIDSRIYTGGYSDRTIKEWSSSLDLIQTVFTEYGGIQKLAITANGQMLVSSSGAAGEGYIGDPDAIDNKVRIRIFDLKTSTNIEYVGHKDEDIIPGLAISKRSGLVAVGGGIKNEIHIFDPRTLGVKSILKAVDAGGPVTGVAFSKDGTKFAWGRSVSNPADYSRYYLNRGVLEFEMGLPGSAGRLGALKPLNPGDVFTQGIKQRQGLSVDAYDKRKAGLGNFKVSIQGGQSFSVGGAIADYTFAPSAELLIASKHFSDLISYDFRGSELGRFVGHTDTILATAVSPDERLLISGAFDGTLRLWNVKTRELIASLFATKNGEWVVWTPQGYYASSPDGDKLVGWQINRGSGNTADYYTARQLKPHFYRPDIVDRALILASATEALEQARKADPERMRFDLSSLLNRKPPAVSISFPAPLTRIAGATADLTVNIESSVDEVTSLDAFVNGARVAGIDTRGFEPVAGNSGLRKITVPLNEGQNHIILRAANAIGMTEQQITLFGGARGALDKKGTLFIVAVGVDKYPHLPNMCGGINGSCDLKYAGADARDFVDEMIKVAGPLYERVESKLLINGVGGDHEPTASNIVNALRLLKKSQELDTAIVFLSGHGANEDIKTRKNYLFLPTDARRDQQGWLDSSVFDWASLEKALGNASGRRILFVDTCHAANSYSAQIVKNAHDDNIAVFSAADGDTVAQERSDLGHGVFTHVILRALRGEAAQDKEVRLLDFASYVDRNVRRLTNEAQQPEYNIQRVKNYVMARMQ